MEEGFFALVQPLVDNGIGRGVFWIVMIIAVPAILLFGVLYLVGKMSSAANKEQRGDEMQCPGEGESGDGGMDD
ncbi:MAG: hypothetical protein GY899_09025 [Verrucomicrobiaceae bacterium]|nr:hypothetical protein [Verrucomicrobiaceae bacterium]